MDKASLATLLISCPDRRGIVASLAQVLTGHGANIVHSDQHTDRALEQFFQRIVFDTAEMTTDRHTYEGAIAEVAERFSMSYRLAYQSDPKKRVAIFVSKYEHCLYDLLLRHRVGELDCEIALVVSNHPDLRPVADQFSVAYREFPKTKETKSEVEAEELALLKAERIDLVVMARKMQNLSDTFIRGFSGSIINNQHSFLPAFNGGRPNQQAHQRGVKHN
jgi:formyltetrahydrofolate deformylase